MERGRLSQLLRRSQLGLAPPTAQNRFARAYEFEHVLCDYVCTDDDLYYFDSYTTYDTQTFSCAFNWRRGDKGGRTLLAVSDEEGNVSLLDTRGGHREQGRVHWQAHTNAIFDVAWSCDDQRLATASGDQTVKVFDIESQTAIAQLVGHQWSVKSVSWHRTDPNILVSSSRDGSVMVWDLRYSGSADTQLQLTRHRPVRVIRNGHGIAQVADRKSASTPKDSLQSVTSALFLNDTTVVSAGASDGTIKCWDLRDVRVNGNNNSPRPMATFKTCADPSGSRSHGVTSLALDENRGHLVASCMNNSILMYSCAQPHRPEPLCTFTAPDFDSKSYFLRAALSADASTVACGSKNGNIYLWHVDEPSRSPLVLSGHTREINGLAFDNVSPHLLASCSDDATVRVWQVDAAKAKAYQQPDRDPFWGGLAKAKAEKPETVYTVSETARTSRESPTVPSPLKRPSSPDHTAAKLNSHLGYPLSPPASSPLKRIRYEAAPATTVAIDGLKSELSGVWPSRGIIL